MNKIRERPPLRAHYQVVATLNRIAGELFNLFSNIKRAHWNTPGLNFIRLDELADQIMGHIDRIAERTAALGGLPEAATNNRARFAYFRFAPPIAMLNGTSGWLQDLADLHAAVSDHVRHAVQQLIAVEDFSSADLLADILRTLNLHLSLLEGQLQTLRN